MTTPDKAIGVGVAEAKKRFSDLLGRVFYGGETIVILRRGRPTAKLVPIGPGEQRRLSEVQGWLSEDDPFLEAVDRIVADRRSHRARAVLADRDTTR